MNIDRYRKPRRHDAGFTLVEVVITIALIGILAAIAAPSVGDMIRRSQSKSLARGFTNHLRVARNQSMSRGEVVVVRVYSQLLSVRGSMETYRTLNNAASCRSIALADVDTANPVATFKAETISEPFHLGAQRCRIHLLPTRRTCHASRRSADKCWWCLFRRSVGALDARSAGGRDRRSIL